MKCSRKVNPGKPGTKKLVAKFGKNLMAVRYRYSKVMSMKTIELIVWKKKKKSQRKES